MESVELHVFLELHPGKAPVRLQASTSRLKEPVHLGPKLI
jgi:hypothetical protein